jgi:hypothetical protein
MRTHDSDALSGQSHDKQLHGISLAAVMEKRRLDQALNAKEFAVCAGVSYSTARSWFHLPGFPVFHGVIFWQDFMRWRSEEIRLSDPSVPQRIDKAATITEPFPPRAAQVLFDANDRC